MRNGQLDLANQDPFHTGNFLFPVLWIRIRMDRGPIDPDPHWECDPDREVTTKIEKVKKFYVLIVNKKNVQYLIQLKNVLL